jgi:hypothetical protein
VRGTSNYCGFAGLVKYVQQREAVTAPGPLAKMRKFFHETDQWHPSVTMMWYRLFPRNSNTFFCKPYAQSPSIMNWLHTVLAVAFGGVATVPAWIALNWVGQPILAIERQRHEALRVADRYAFISPRENDDRIREIRRTLFDVGCSLRTDARSLPRPARVYRKLIGRYDFEGAADAILGLAEMAGDVRFHDSTRQNQLDWAYISLRAAHHLSSDRIQFVKEEVVKAKRDWRREF